MKKQLKTINVTGIKKLENIHQVVGGTVQTVRTTECCPACGMNGSDLMFVN